MDATTVLGRVYTPPRALAVPVRDKRKAKAKKVVQKKAVVRKAAVK